MLKYINENKISLFFFFLRFLYKHKRDIHTLRYKSCSLSACFILKGKGLELKTTSLSILRKINYKHLTQQQVLSQRQHISCQKKSGEKSESGMKFRDARRRHLNIVMLESAAADCTRLMQQIPLWHCFVDKLTSSQKDQPGCNTCFTGHMSFLPCKAA